MEFCSGAFALGKALPSYPHRKETMIKDVSSNRYMMILLIDACEGLEKKTLNVKHLLRINKNYYLYLMHTQIYANYASS